MEKKAYIAPRVAIAAFKEKLMLSIDSRDAIEVLTNENFFDDAEEDGSQDNSRKGWSNNLW